MMKLAVAAIAAAGMTLFVSGCSFFGSKTQQITVMTEPGDAEVIINSKPCRSPASAEVPTDKPLAVVVRKDGYQTESRTMRPVLSKLGMLDLVGTILILVPGVGLFSAGAQELPQSDLYFALEKAE
ncbi:MAG: hypothetical protein HPZ91_05465 [Lentisphaeria bacterium]|nr:hypothetical protein [Lentisphaeria bacterium]